jgi:predicted dehydrogenase
VLVRTEHSLISAGTEKMKVDESKLSLVGKAKARPDQVKKVLENVAQQGVASTYRKVANKLDSYTPLGYSVAGVVVEVGEGCEELTVGQRVACAGDKNASHAEYNWVPKNLVVPVPDRVSSEHAAFTTVGSIALHGFRRSEAVLGETAVVIGLGLIGQLLVQIIHAAGVKVVGVDVSPDRCHLAMKLGAVAAATPGSDDYASLREVLSGLTGGHGADHVFLTVGTSERDPVLMAAELARDRATVVDIGKTNLDLPWNSYYEKELEMRFSRSYGPGRYDPLYEERGVDYPIGYVRWTERRNMAAFLDLVADGRIDLAPLLSGVHPFDRAVEVYGRLHEGTLGGIANVFTYPVEARVERTITRPRPVPTVVGGDGAVRIGMIGAGNYASTMLLPHLTGRDDVELRTVATQTSLSAATAQTKFGFRSMTTDNAAVLEDPEIEAVVIATRHESHAAIAAQALEAGKAVFVEKPPAVDRAQLDHLLATIERTGNDRLMVGYNRRFAPLLVDLARSWGRRTGPMAVQYSINAGRLESGSWYADAETQGTRFVGEGGHFVDTVSWLIGARPVAVSASAAGEDPDNVIATISFDDGSVGVVAYLTDGSSRFPKEVLTVSGGARTGHFLNFRSAEVWSGGKRRKLRSIKGVDKGQQAQLDAFVGAVRRGEPMPIGLDSLVSTSLVTFAVTEAVVSGRTVQLDAR